ncbi:recombination regulator RecX [Allofustis seminis]|uniref:recombination regulator RecX n=1 Tax=Allofustis seminis TaxID=166939 RepID=UPI0003811316|nr:recombination regulator RecX [Allofustis seminis]
MKEETKHLINLSKASFKKEDDHKNLESNITNFTLPQKKHFGNQPIITQIQAQKQAGRYNIYIDHQFAFGIDENILIQYQLQKGMEIPQSFQEQIQKQEKIQKAYQNVLNYLSYGLRTEKEIEHYLLKKEYSDEIPAVIDKLKKMQLIDDFHYASSYVRISANISRKGPYRIRQELLKKGINEENIQNAMINYPVQQQLENASHLAAKYFKKLKNISQREAQSKIMKHLQMKGYDFDVIQEIMADNIFEMDSDDEFATLKALGLRTLKKYTKKFPDEPYQAREKMLAYLYRKGFKKELIAKFLEQLDEGLD